MHHRGARAFAATSIVTAVCAFGCSRVLGIKDLADDAGEAVAVAEGGDAGGGGDCAPESGSPCVCAPPPDLEPTKITGDITGAINALFDRAGNMYVSAFYGGYVTKIAPGATTGPEVFHGPNPQGLAEDRAGTIYVAWAHSTISRLDPATGTTSVVVDSLCDAGDMAFGPDGLLYVAAAKCGRVYRVDAKLGSKVELLSVGKPGVAPTGLSFDAIGDLFIGGGSDGNVYKRAPNGELSTFASGLPWPLAVRADPTGVYVSGQTSNRVVKLSPDGSACPSALLPDTQVFALTYDDAHNLFATSVRSQGVYLLSL